MTRWRAVFAGVLLAVLAEATVYLATGGVTLVAGLAGSALAGYLGGDQPVDGAWHGLLAALAWGTVLIPAVVVLTLAGDAALPVPFGVLLPAAGSPGGATAVILLCVTLPNVLVGAVGAVVRVRVGAPTPG